MDEKNPYGAPSSNERPEIDDRPRRVTPLRIGIALIGAAAAISIVAPRNLNMADARAQGEAFGRSIVQLAAFVGGIACILYHVHWRRRHKESQDT